MSMVTIGIARCGRPRWNGYLFAGSDAGGERAAVAYTLIETAKLNGLDPEAIWSAVKFSIFRPIEGRPLLFEPPGISTARAPAT